MKSRILAVVLSALLIVGGLNLAAYAATGGKFLLGKKNTATKTTKLTNNGNGPALALKNKANSPPLSVSSTKKVTKLNADLVDGLDGKALQTAGYRFAIPAAPTSSVLILDFPGLPAGVYDAKFSIVGAFATPQQLFCGFRRSNPNEIHGMSTGGDALAISAASGSAMLDTRNTRWQLYCNSTENFSVGDAASDGYLSAVTFVRVDSLSTKTAALP